MADKRRQFTREFKLEAVRQLTDSEHSLAEIARQLGIRVDLLRSWKRQAEGRVGFSDKDIFPGHGIMPSQEEELRQLRRELEQTKQERDFLKKAAAYFAKQSR